MPRHSFRDPITGRYRKNTLGIITGTLHKTGSIPCKYEVEPIHLEIITKSSQGILGKLYGRLLGLLRGTPTEIPVQVDMLKILTEK